MPRQGNGTYVLPSGNPVISGTVIRSAWANTTMSDIAAALTGSIARDGQSVPTANLPMAGFRFTNVGLGAALTDFARVSQVQDGSLLRCTAEGNTADAYTASLPFGSTSFVNGQVIVLIFPSSNTTTSPTLNINGSANWPILRADGSSIQVGDCRTGVPSQLIWNTTGWLLLGAGSGGGSAGVSSFNSRLGAVTLLSADVTTALAYTPANKAGDTFTGPVTLAGDASNSLQPVTLQQMLSAIASIPTVAGVSSFNSRTGAVLLTSTDVTNALTYVPVQSFNGRAGAVTLTSGDVTTALGFTPQTQLGTFSYVFATKSADVAVTGGAPAALATFTNEIADSLNEFSASRFTASAAGTYAISAILSYNITAGTSKEDDIFIYKNGSALLTQRTSLYDIGTNSVSIYATLKLVATDFIEIYFSAFHSGTLQGGAAPYASYLTIARII